MNNAKAIQDFLDYRGMAEEAERLNKLVGRLLTSEPGSRSCRIARTRRHAAEEKSFDFFTTNRCSIEHGKRILEGINR